MKVYVASAYGEYERARSVMRQLKLRGVETSHDWTAMVDAYPDDNAPAELRAAHAREDLEGVRSADAVIVLTQGDKSIGCGMWIEFGAALALGKPVFITGEQMDRSVFCELALQCPSDIDAVHCAIYALQESEAV